MQILAFLARRGKSDADRLSGKKKDTEPLHLRLNVQTKNWTLPAATLIYMVKNDTYKLSFSLIAHLIMLFSHIVVKGV